MNKSHRRISTRRRPLARGASTLGGHFEILEGRQMLSGSKIGLPVVAPWTAHTNFFYKNGSDTIAPQGSVSPVGLIPSQIRGAYGLNNIVGDGAGQTIAIVDAFNDPYLYSSSDSANYATSDLYKFNAQFGIAQFGGAGPTFTKINQTGGTSYPANPTGTNAGWATEIALDVEWAHAIAPQANITLVEATDNSSNLYTAVAYARNSTAATTVSMSWGGSEFSGEAGYSSTYFSQPAGRGVSYFAASGDNGAPGLFPSYAPNVVSVGGTNLTQTNGVYGSEAGWSGSGGGISTQIAKPTYQSAVTQSATQRTIPDIASSGGPSSSVAVLDSYNNGTSAPWGAVYGTSFACPVWAAITSIVDQKRVAGGLGTLSSTYVPNSTTTIQAKLYALPASDFHDVTTGNNGFAAGTGYDLVTGIGTPISDLLIPDLAGVVAGVSTPDLVAASDHGPSSTDNLTNVNLPTFSGTTTGSGTATLLVDGVANGTATVAGGAYTVTAATAIPDGTHAITVQVGAVTSSPLSVSIDTVAPQLTGTNFDYSNALQKVTLSFNDDISASLSASDLVVTNAYDSSTIPTASTAVTYNSGTNTATLTFPGFANGTLPNGNYTASAASGSITDLAGNAVSNPVSSNFYFVMGDANHDGKVDISDLGILASNWQQAGKNYSQGDFDYSNNVDISDLGLLASNWQFSLGLGSSLPQAASPIPVDTIIPKSAPAANSSAKSGKAAPTPVSSSVATASRSPFSQKAVQPSAAVKPRQSSNNLIGLASDTASDDLV